MMYNNTSSSEDTAVASTATATAASWQEWKPTKVENRFKRSDADFMAAATSTTTSTNLSTSLSTTDKLLKKSASTSSGTCTRTDSSAGSSESTRKEEEDPTVSIQNEALVVTARSQTTASRTTSGVIFVFVVALLSIITARMNTIEEHSISRISIEHSTRLLFYSICWSVAQFIHSIDGNNNKIAEYLEQLSWSMTMSMSMSMSSVDGLQNKNEHIHMNINENKRNNLCQIRTLSLTCSEVEQEISKAMTMTTNTIHKINDTHFCMNWDPKYEDEDEEFTTTSKGFHFDFDLDFDLDLDFDSNLNDFISEPLLIPNLASYASPSQPMLSLSNLSQSPLENLQIQYFSDSTKYGASALQPNAKASLREIVYNVTNYDSSTIKIGTQVPVETFPHLIANIAPNDFVSALFGDRFRPDDLKPILGVFPPLTTVPIFLARGLVLRHYNEDEDLDGDNNNPLNSNDNGEENHDEDDKVSKNGSSNDGNSCVENVRTDMHCEPIGNISMQLEGSKKWTLVQSRYSKLLQPTVAKHGRAFFYSSLDPFDAHALDNIPRYEVVTKKGDGLWLPPWTWHRVDYIPGEISLAASLFHFRPVDFFKNNALFAVLIIPNLIKELLGWKTE